jgi:hypothetical protein
MGGGLEVVGCVCVMRADRLSILVAMSSCLDESRSCSVVDPGGRFLSDVASIICHLVAIAVARGSWMEELCVRLFRCSGDSACRSLRK